MKKTTLRSFMLATTILVSAFFSGCNTEDVEFQTPEIAVSPTTLHAPSKNICEATFDVTTNRAWKVIIPADVDWVVATPASGNGNGKVTLSMLSNDQGPREADIKVATTTVYATLKLIQPGAYELTEMFHMNFGAPTTTTPIAGYTGWGATGISSGTATYSASASGADIRSTAPSLGYAGASGGGNVFLNSSSNGHFQINNLNVNTGVTTDYALSFGCYSFGTPYDPTTLIVETSIDGGTTWTLLAYTRASVNAQWGLSTSAPFSIAAGVTSLNIRFTAANGGQPRIDDINLEARGTVTVTAFPSVSTTAYLPADITTTTATLGGTYTYAASTPTITELGVAYKETSATGDFTFVPAISATATPFAVSITSLGEATAYSYKAYAKIGTVYYFGDLKAFTTKATYVPPTPVASYSDAFNSISATNVAYDGAGWYFSSTDAAIANSWKTSLFSNALTGLQDKSIQIAPYASTAASVTAYAVMPPVNPSTSANDLLYLSYTSYYNTATDNSVLEVVVTPDFTGNVATSTWTSVATLPLTSAVAKANVWRLKSIDLSAYSSATKLFVALRYVGKGDTYRVDMVQFGLPRPTLEYLAPKLAGTFVVGTALTSAAKITIPYIYANGETVNVNVTTGNGVTGTFSGALGTDNGEYLALEIPLTGTPTTEGNITFTISGLAGLTTNTVSGTVKPAGSGPVYSSNMTFPSASNSTSAYYPENVILDAVTYPCLKLGTSSKVGTYEFTAPLIATVPSTATFTMYGVAWAGKNCPVTITVNNGGTINGAASATFTCLGNAGAANSSPYTLTVDDTNLFTAQLAGLTSASTITVASGTNYRAILFGLNIK